MWVTFDSLGKGSRVWIYQSGRALTPSEVASASDKLQAFCEQWEAHGNPLRSSFKIENSQFLILAVDEAWSGASGCSIDGSVRVLKALQSELGLDLFDRSKQAFLVDGEVTLLPVSTLKASFSNGILGSGSLTFNTLAANKGDLDTSWIIPVDKSWLAKYLPKPSLA